MVARRSGEGGPADGTERVDGVPNGLAPPRAPGADPVGSRAGGRERLPGGLIGETIGSNVATLARGVVVAIAGLGAEGTQRRADSGARFTSTASSDEMILLIRADVE